MGRSTATTFARRARRRRLAMWACLLWLLGIEVLPDLHLALHDTLAAHDHGGGRSAATAGWRVEATTPVAAPSHAHGDVVHRHDAGAPPGHDDTPHARPVPPSPGDHGDHSLAHRSVAWLAPPPAVTAPLPVDRRPVIVPAIALVVRISDRPPIAAARGPPATFLTAT